jgi:hypothetical protein
MIKSDNSLNGSFLQAAYGASKFGADRRCFRNQKLTVKSTSGDVVEQSVNLEQFLNSS